MDKIESLNINSEKNIIFGNYQRIKEDNSFDCCVYWILKNYYGNNGEIFKKKLEEKDIPFKNIKVNIKGYKNINNQNSGLISFMNLEKFINRLKNIIS